MTPIRWLRGHMYANPQLPRRWTWLAIFTTTSQAVSWTVSPHLWAATPTTTPAAAPPATIPDLWPWATTALALLGLGASLIWRGRARGLR